MIISDNRLTAAVATSYAFLFLQTPGTVGSHSFSNGVQERDPETTSAI